MGLYERLSARELLRYFAGLQGMEGRTREARLEEMVETFDLAPFADRLCGKVSTETVIRFLPTAWIGLLLGYVVWHTRPVYTGMLMHFASNAATVLLVSFATL